MAIEIIFNIILGLFIVFYLFEAMQLPDIDSTADVLGAGGFPLAVAILALLVLLFISINTVREKTEVRRLFSRNLPEGRLLLNNIFLFTGYMVLLNVLGFAVSTLLYLFIAPTSFGYSRWGTLAVFSIAGSVILVGIFGSLFYVPLPRGIGLFRELSYLVY